MLFIGVEVEQETSAPPPKRNPGSAPAAGFINLSSIACWQSQHLILYTAPCLSSGLSLSLTLVN